MCFQTKSGVQSDVFPNEIGGSNRCVSEWNQGFKKLCFHMKSGVHIDVFPNKIGGRTCPLRSSSSPPPILSAHCNENDHTTASMFPVRRHCVVIFVARQWKKSERWNSSSSVRDCAFGEHLSQILGWSIYSTNFHQVLLCNDWYDPAV